MNALILAITAVLSHGDFVADASAERQFFIPQAEARVRTRCEDIFLLRRNMPGVVAITPAGPGQWVYTTERRMPFSEVVKTEFCLVQRRDSAITYYTPLAHAANWMSFRLEPKTMDNGETAITVRVRVRLVRENGASIHVFAPVLGESFISDRMHEDLEDMLAVFAANVLAEFSMKEDIVTPDSERR